MNDLNPALNPEQERLIYSIVSALLTPAQKGECKCHWIDPTKTPILAWKSAKDPNTLVLKIATQKFIGLTRSDKKNELYWKFRDFYEGGVADQPTPTAPKPEKPVEPKIDLPSSSEAEKVQLEDSETVKKFREKYGTAASPKTA